MEQILDGIMCACTLVGFTALMAFVMMPFAIIGKTDRDAARKDARVN